MLQYKFGHQKFLPAPGPDAIRKIMTSMIEQINDDHELSSELIAFNGILRFEISDIDYDIDLDLRESPISVHFEPIAERVDLRIESKIQDFHLYWCHQLNLMPAITAKTLLVKGPVQKAMALNNATTQLRDLYQEAWTKFKD
jgi:hypothetical protein